MDRQPTFPSVSKWRVFGCHVKLQSKWAIPATTLSFCWGCPYKKLPLYDPIHSTPCALVKREVTILDVQRPLTCWLSQVNIRAVNVDKLMFRNTGQSFSQVPANSEGDLSLQNLGGVSHSSCDSGWYLPSNGPDLREEGIFGRETMAEESGIEP